MQEAREQEAGGSERLESSPQHLAMGNVIMPIVTDKIFAGIQTRYMSSRLTEAEAKSKNVFLTTVTLFTQQLVTGWEFSAQLNNLFDYRYGDPASGEHRQDTIEQDGRTFWVKLKYRF
jgi:iron complex outermembrane receptor protein